jgi:hypothetical protein
MLANLRRPLEIGLVASFIAGGVFVACMSDPQAPGPGSNSPQAARACAGDPFSDAYMRRVIGTLAQPAWEGRKFDGDGLKEATKWVASEFACVGLVPGAPSLTGLPSGAFEQPFETEGDAIDPPGEISGYTYQPGRKFTFTNVLGSIPGKGALADEVVVLGAHVDHMGRYGAERDAVVLGADDDASGVLALIAVAKQLLSEEGATDLRTLVFAAWGVEEDPFFRRGSRAFMGAIDAGARTKIVYYVNFDMVGGYKYYSNVNVLGTYAGSPARTILDRLRPSYPALAIELGSRGSSSDHETFCENGIPYAFFWTQDDCYHKPCDTAEAVDYVHLAPILRVATSLTRGLATEPGLARAKQGFVAAYADAWPGMTCQSEDED